MNLIEVMVRVSTHNFTIHVTDKGALTYIMDDGAERYAKKLENGELVFTGKVEAMVRGELHEWRSIKLPEEEYERLVSVQEHTRNAIIEEQTMARLKREDKSQILKRVDKWKKRVRYYKKEQKGERLPYGVHDFTIGAQSYRFYERRLDSPVSRDGIVINPAYKVDRELPGAGAVPIQKGELTFWYYYSDGGESEDDKGNEESTGWYNVRELTLNEMICVEIIHSYGLVHEGKL